MPSNAQTRGQVAARYERLKKRMEIVKASDDMSKPLIEIAKMTLEMFPVTAAAAAASMPKWQDAQSFMKSLTPSPSEVFTDDFFKRPLFPVVTLHDVAKFYGCPPIQDSVFGPLALPAEDSNSKNVKIHVWFADFLECEKDLILDVVRSYKAHRGASGIARRFPISPAPVIQDQEAQDVAAPAPERVQESNARSETPRLHDPRALRDQTAIFSDNTRNAPYAATSDNDDSRKATNVFQCFKGNKNLPEIFSSLLNSPLGTTTSVPDNTN
eukprot:Plantae.Rhodophyta-Hildenbrandia_rubra.ctg14051.p1 GENE.Plantae.Rhodophyta-Hildenbrandia_rubra.ctg14051~~Plantae.Rhodophyta-Hildenbrandia_rubra.ctg14051.p1  ORF type:complete len:269 (-),score=29.64 Plantae.Rhodophyta-Hildenbrandia_rubra.ctg14051:865-1671(-)